MSQTTEQGKAGTKKVKADESTLGLLKEKNRLLKEENRLLEEESQLLTASKRLLSSLQEVYQHLNEAKDEYINFLEQHSALLDTAAASCESKLGRKVAQMRLEVHGEQGEELQLRCTIFKREVESLKREIKRLDSEKELLAERIKVVQQELKANNEKSSKA